MSSLAAYSGILPPSLGLSKKAAFFGIYLVSQEAVVKIMILNNFPKLHSGLTKPYISVAAREVTTLGFWDVVFPSLDHYTWSREAKSGEVLSEG